MNVGEGVDVAEGVDVGEGLILTKSARNVKAV